MRTIPGHIDRAWPKGTFQARCDYCGAGYMRHQLMRNSSGFLSCPDCRYGRDEVLLNRLNAEAGSKTKGIRYPGKYLGGANPRDQSLPVIHRTTAADIGKYKDSDVTPPTVAVANTAAPYLGTSTAATLSVSWPVGTNAGQLGLLLVHTHNHPIPTPAGWNSIGSTGIGTADTNNTSIGLQVFWRVSVTSAGPPAILTRSGSFVAGRICTVVGYNEITHDIVAPPGNPIIDASTVAYSNAAATGFSYNAYAAVDAGAMICYAVATGQSNALGALQPAPAGLGAMFSAVVNGDQNGIDGNANRVGSAALWTASLSGRPSGAAFSQSISSSVSSVIQFQIRRAY